MNCPVCGMDLRDKKECECGWKNVEEVAQEENSEVVSETLDQQDLQLEEDVEKETYETAFETEDELEEYLEENGLDFDEIEENSERIVRPTKKKTPWGVAIVSFICGILTTLIVIGSLNGMIVKTFDKVLYGSPETPVTTFFECVYETNDAEAFVKVISPYQREIVKQNAIQFVAYGYTEPFDAKDDVDVLDDKQFLPYAKAYLSYFSSSGYDIKITNFEIKEVVYHNNASETYKTYSKDYEPQSVKNSNVQLYADVDVSIDISISGNGTKEDANEQYKVVCAKIDGNWTVVNVGAKEQ